MPVNQKTRTRIVGELKQFIQVIEDAKKRDISESDTVVIIGDMLASVMGYRKYTEITTEFAIRGTYVDLAIKINGEVWFLIEAKAINTELKPPHVKQAVDYAANQGIEWVVLTNATRWQVYRVGFGQPITSTLVLDLDLPSAGHRSDAAIEVFGNLSREAFTKSSMQQVFHHRQATSAYALTALLLAEETLSGMRRELRRLNPGLRIETDEIAQILKTEVIKRDLVESDEAIKAAASLKKLGSAAARRKLGGVKERAASSGAPEPGHARPQEPGGGA